MAPPICETAPSHGMRAASARSSLLLDEHCPVVDPVVLDCPDFLELRKRVANRTTELAHVTSVATYAFPESRQLKLGRAFAGQEMHEQSALKSGLNSTQEIPWNMSDIAGEKATD